MNAVNQVLDALRSCGLLVADDEEEPGYFPARDLASVSVKQLLEAVRSAGEDPALTPHALPAPMPVDMVLRKLDDSTEAALGSIPLRDLAGPPPAEDPDQPALLR
jgi:membrane protein